MLVAVLWAVSTLAPVLALPSVSAESCSPARDEVLDEVVALQLKSENQVQKKEGGRKRISGVGLALDAEALDAEAARVWASAAPWPRWPWPRWSEVAESAPPGTTRTKLEMAQEGASPKDVDGLLEVLLHQCTERRGDHYRSREGIEVFLGLKDNFRS